jgi:hypothetical protein
VSTYLASKYRTARKAKTCDRCKGEIAIGEVYLDYKPGLRSHLPVCSACSVAKNPGGDLAYLCSDVVTEIQERAGV